MKVLRTAVVGLGRIGWKYHIPKIVEHEGFELTAIVDPLNKRLSEGESKYNVKGYSNYSDLLEKEELDLAVIASPTTFHAEQTIMAMEKGVDVFLEKPMAANLEETDKIISTMQKLGRKLMVYQPHRTNTETQTVKYIIESDIIGTVFMIKRAICYFERRNDWQAQKKFNGGNLNNAGAHFVDQLLYLTGSKAKTIACHLRNIASIGDADDVVKILIKTDNSVILDLDISSACTQAIPQWVIMGKSGTAIYQKDENGGSFHIKYFVEDELGDLTLISDMAAPERKYGNNDKIPWKEKTINCSDFKNIDFYTKCYDYFAEGKEPYVPVKDTREVMRVMSECHKMGW